jgi:C1A family cysteine protease
MPAKLTEKIAPVLTPWYGWKPDIPDFRDLRLERPTLKAALPEAVDLRPQFPPAFNQGEIGSCTANAIAAALRFESRRQKQKDFPFSRLFIYYCEREVEGTVGEDAGAMIRTGIKVAQLPKEDYAIVLNSWDVDWGVKGCFYMPMRYLLDPNLADDFWCIQAIE